MSLRVFHWLTAVFVLISGAVVQARGGVVREIRLHVLELNGKPAVGRQVQLWGVSRGFRGDDEAKPNWDFVTNRAGSCVVKLGDHKGDVDAIPGWGTYALRVVPGPKDAGAFSPYLIHEDGAWGRKDQMQNRKDLEWGRPLVIARRKTELTLQIEPGFTIRGRVLGYPGREPRPGVEVGGMYDLYADSHTGWGARVDGPSTKTDANGRYILRHVYPSKLLMGATPTWVQTRRDRSPWVTDRLDQIEPARGQTVVSLDIAVAEGKPFRVFGHVQDAAGQPIENAQISVEFARHRVPSWWHEEHTDRTPTNAKGEYELWLETPWITSISVNAGR